MNFYLAINQCYFTDVEHAKMKAPLKLLVKFSRQQLFFLLSIKSVFRKCKPFIWVSAMYAEKSFWKCLIFVLVMVDFSSLAFVLPCRLLTAFG